VTNVDVCLLLFLDANPWWVAGASGAFLSLLATFAYGWVKRRWDKEDKAEASEKSGVQTGIAGLGIQVEAEVERRRADIATEARERREADAELGCDIQDIRGVIGHDFGTRGKEPPRWRDKK